MLLYDRRDLVKMRELEKEFAVNPLSDEKVIVKLEKDIFLRGIKSRCILNTYIFEVLEDFDVPHDIRKELIYRDNYYKGRFNTYMNHVIELCKERIDNPVVMLPHLLGDIFSCFHRLSVVSNETLSMDHSLMGYLRAYEQHPEFAELFRNPVIKKTDDPYTVEKKYEYINDTIIKADVHPLSDFLKSGVKSNKLQIMGFVQVGLQPDQLDPGKVKNNTISGWLNGLRNVPDMVHLDNQALEAVIKGKNEVQEPGELGKLINVALTETKINKDVTRAVVHDCGTHDYEIVKIKSKKDLQKYRYKYIVDPITYNILGYVDLNRTDLIGAMVSLRMLHHCHGVNCVCEVCTGANNKFLQDTGIFKNNIYEYGMHVIGGKFQKVISIKHSNNAFVKPIPVIFRGNHYENILDFILDTDYITDFEFDKLIFAVGTKVELRDMDGYRFKRLFINDEYVDILLDKPIELNGLTLTIYIPNDSVLLTAKDIQVMLRMHSSTSKYLLPEDKWDRTGLSSMTRAEQLSSFYKYCQTKVSFDHSMYYEMIVNAMMRDAADLSSKPTEKTELIDIIHVNQLTSSVDKSKKFSNKIHHGYVKSNILSVIPVVEPCEADVLYNIVDNRELTEADVPKELQRILREDYDSDIELKNEYNYEVCKQICDVSQKDDDYSDDEED